MLSETIVLLWLLPVVLNIALPLTALGIWLGIKLIALVRSKMTGEEGAEAESVPNRILSAPKG